MPRTVRGEEGEMDLLPIGAFARASRLTPKALRLYDELGLLSPARVDPSTGYRYYAAGQLERARLVAWLRRIGMPLAQIRTVCGVPPEAAARQVRAFWAGVEADTAERRALAAVLLDHLTAKEPAMTRPAVPLQLHYAVASDPGLARPSNQDAAHASARMLAVADGCGPQGARASTAAIDSLASLATATAGDLLNALQDAVAAANRSIATLSGGGEGAELAGSTLTAMVLDGSTLGLVHIGDCRAYLLRGGELSQITHDHTVVQGMVDDGRLSPEEARSHPQRAMLVRVLDGNAEHATPDVRLHDAQPGDRYLLCSDGLSAVVAAPAIHRVLATVADPQAAVTELVATAHASGAPDNVSCVVADLVPAALTVA